MALQQLLVSLDNHLEHEIQCAFCTIFFFFFALVLCSPFVLCSSSPVRIYVFKLQVLQLGGYLDTIRKYDGLLLLPVMPLPGHQRLCHLVIFCVSV